jgi:hypothetical protein
MAEGRPIPPINDRYPVRWTRVSDVLRAALAGK